MGVMDPRGRFSCDVQVEELITRAVRHRVEVSPPFFFVFFFWSQLFCACVMRMLSPRS